MLGPIFRRIFVTFLLIIPIALFTCLSEVGAMKTVMLDLIKLLSFTGTGDKIFFINMGIYFASNVLVSFIPFCS